MIVSEQNILLCSIIDSSILHCPTPPRQDDLRPEPRMVVVGSSAWVRFLVATSGFKPLLMLNALLAQGSSCWSGGAALRHIRIQTWFKHVSAQGVDSLSHGKSMSGMTKTGERPIHHRMFTLEPASAASRAPSSTRYCAYDQPDLKRSTATCPLQNETRVPLKSCCLRFVIRPGVPMHSASSTRGDEVQ